MKAKNMGPAYNPSIQKIEIGSNQGVLSSNDRHPHTSIYKVESNQGQHQPRTHTYTHMLTHVHTHTHTHTHILLHKCKHTHTCYMYNKTKSNSLAFTKQTPNTCLAVLFICTCNPTLTVTSSKVPDSRNTGTI
jgi:putative component of membrane protein insertase Oxa1/YidC/SpoIIIJ protein YidD